MPHSPEVEPADQRPTEGLVGGKYDLVRLIGRGGMGAVWEARHASLGTRVAIKFVEAERAQNEEARRRFENEARAAASIESKHAIKVYDHGFLGDGRPYIVMELLAGEPLDRRLDTHGRISVEATARIVVHVARALQQAHDSGITHRDLKPDNIFLCQGDEDDEETAKVLDFGIAKIVDPASDVASSSSTRTGVLMGTPSYMSPEQARGLKTVDWRSDLWGVGVIVFRCVTGVLPFRGEALGDLLVKICASTTPVPSSVLPGLSPDFDAWMAKALDREPEQRFQTAREMAEALASVAGLPVRSSSGKNAVSFTPTPIGAADVTVLAVTPPTQKSPGAIPPPPDTEVESRPVAMITSSPLTTSSHPPQPPRRDLRNYVLGVVGLSVLVLAAASTVRLAMRTAPVASPSASLVSAAALPVPPPAPPPAAPVAVEPPPVHEPPPPVAPSSPPAAVPVHPVARSAGSPAAKSPPSPPRRASVTAPKPLAPTSPLSGSDPGY